jgi:hypothetical protein
LISVFLLVSCSFLVRCPFLSLAHTFLSVRCIFVALFILINFSLLLCYCIIQGYWWTFNFIVSSYVLGKELSWWHFKSL